MGCCLRARLKKPRFDRGLALALAVFVDECAVLLDFARLRGGPASVCGFRLDIMCRVSKEGEDDFKKILCR